MAFSVFPGTILAQDAEPYEQNKLAERKFDIDSDEDFQDGFVLMLMYSEKNLKVHEKRQIIKSDPKTYKEHKEYHSNGKQKIAAYQNSNTGKCDGDYIEYYENGKPKFEGFIIDGSWAGKVTAYHNNGKIYYSDYYDNGKQIGRWEYFDENGKAEELQMYAPNGKLIASVKLNADGFFDGEKKFYDENGHLKTVEHYKKGKKIN